MKNIQIYTTNNCPFCVNAKRLLKAKGVTFEEINVSDDEMYLLNKLAKKTGVYTLPQIFADNEFIGGCDDLYQLERQNQLDKVLT